MKNTIVVNLFAGPGAGKSTCAAYVFSKLKMLGVDVEYVSEFAKDKVWEQNAEVFKCQLYISGKQAFKVARVNGKVDVIITDSPIALGAIYSNEEPIQNACLYEFLKYNNLNIFLTRGKRPYDSNGRNQTEAEAKVIDAHTLKWLTENHIDYTKLEGDITGYDELVNLIQGWIK